MHPHLFPKKFTESIIHTHGESGRLWLSTLPGIIEYAKHAYHLSDIKVLPDLTFNYTTSAKQSDGQSIVVKFCLPGIETNHEIHALEIMQGEVIANLIASDKERGILLLEKCESGKRLSTIQSDEEATRITANIIKKLLRPMPKEVSFPTTYEWFGCLGEVVDLPFGFDKSYIDRAKSIARELHNQGDNHFLLHGDLHHFNILSAERQPWLAIDPKGVIGPPEYECGAFLRNPIPQIAEYPNLKNILLSRVAIFSEILGFDRKIILRWAYAQAVLASVWCVDMHSEDWRVFLKVADILWS